MWQNIKLKILYFTAIILPGRLWCIGGRLDKAALNYEKRNPLRLFHCGPQQLLSSASEQFWPISGRTLARKVVRNCVICTKLKGKTMEMLIGDLPVERITQFYSFQICGTDFAGPFMISSKKVAVIDLQNAIYVCSYALRPRYYI